MGSKGGGGGGGGGAQQPPPQPPPPPVVVCCMCGDHGLQQEIFRCKICLFRSQHKYCSDLYPKAESYRACNWCLREEGAKHFHYKEENTTIENHNSNNNNNNNNNNNSTSSSSNTITTSNTNGTNGLKLHRGSFSSHLNKPIKKQRLLLNRSASDVTERLRTPEEVSPSSLGKARQPFRGKVRRYKLLEEVSS